MPSWHAAAAEALRPATIGVGFTVNVEVTPLTGAVQPPADVYTIELIVIVVFPELGNAVVTKLAAPVPPVVVIDALDDPVFAPLSV